MLPRGVEVACFFIALITNSWGPQGAVWKSPKQHLCRVKHSCQWPAWMPVFAPFPLAQSASLSPACPTRTKADATAVKWSKHTHTHTHKHFSEPGYAKGSAGVKSWSNLIQAWIKSQVSNLEVERKHTGKFFGFWEAEERGREHLGSIWMGNERRGGAAAVCSACWGKWYRTVFPTLAPEITSA